MKCVFLLFALLGMVAIGYASKPKGKFLPICPRFHKERSFITGTRSSKIARKYPSKLIKGALQKNKSLKTKLQERTKGGDRVKAVPSQSVSVGKSLYHPNPCPYSVEYLWNAYNCWVVFPRVQTVRCSTRRCNIGPYYGKRTGRCLESSFVTYPYVLLACPSHKWFTFKWRAVTVARSCSCWPCFY